ncbi:hypothetical protein [Acidibrevibacterium fodinaquatile]|uniref:hypothetical protein n=1 Tax=Acidibrevibacterium fodinaquatile TaxID=1969806 RepID=UPI000E0D0A69|nr:hypothetical protein [Acidibrevibacterium fodinaquatile]
MRSITRSVAVATLFGFGFLAPAAWATPVLDQEYTPTPSIQYAAFSGGSFRRAETFTVGIAGTLAEITVDTTSSNSAFTGVNILSTSGGTPTTTVLDVGTFDSTNAAGVSTFTVSLPVTVGEVLGIEPIGNNGTDWLQHSTYPQPYAGGSDFVLNPNVFGPDFISDYAGDGFATYVDPPGSSSVPEPMSLAILASGVIGLTFAHRKTREREFLPNE